MIALESVAFSGSNPSPETTARWRSSSLHAARSFGPSVRLKNGTALYGFMLLVATFATESASARSPFELSTNRTPSVTQLSSPYEPQYPSVCAKQPSSPLSPSSARGLVYFDDFKSCG